jgi:hypothetical protein
MKEGRITSEMAPFGELYFDFCNYYPETAGRVALHPVALACLQQEFRKVGCQAKGAGYPSSMYAPEYASKTLNQIRAMFRGFREDMTGAQTVAGQQSAVDKCLGIRLSGAPGASATGRIFCNERGIEYMVFSYDVGGTRTLRSRFKSVEGLLKDPATATGRSVQLSEQLGVRLGAATKAGIPGADKMGYIARTAFTVAKDSGNVEAKWIVVPDTYTLRLNGETIVPIKLLTKTSDPRTNQFQITVAFRASEERNMMEINYKGVAGATWGNPAFEYIDRNLEIFQLKQSFFDPVIRYDFHKGNMLDINGLTSIRTDAVVLTNRTDVRSNQPNAELVTRQGLTWRVKPTIQGNIVPIEGMRIRNGSISMIMMSVYMTSEMATLYRLTYNDRYSERLLLTRTSVIYEHSVGVGGTGRLEFKKTGDGMLNRWVHVAVIYNHTERQDPNRQRDIQTIAVYVDGVALTPTTSAVVIDGYARPWEHSMGIDM